MKIMSVVGARPNFMKIAPLLDEFDRQTEIDSILVHTGQHYDERMSELFFRNLGIPQPDIDLGVGSSSHAVQTAEIMKAFEPVVLEHRPDLVVVVGDVNSTIACGLVAVKLGVELVHVEAGLRSFDRSMPEEINRVLTDTISDYLFCTEKSAVDNLRSEGKPEENVFLVGNVMIDTLLKHMENAESSTVLNQLELDRRGFAVLTLHRPSNVDNEAVFAELLTALDAIQREIPIIFPVHPRTRAKLTQASLGKRAAEMRNLRMVEPLGYLDFIKLLRDARLVLTDSGGIQEETTILETPCLTLRENTERPVTVEVGTNKVVGTDPDRIVEAFREVLDDWVPPKAKPPLWDGRASARITATLLDRKC